jgi:hypothetical protein
MKYLLTLMTAILLLTSCDKDDDNTNSVISSKRTVIVYMSAENSLSTIAVSNLNDMIKGSKGIDRNDNLIVMFDNANSSKKPCIYRVANGDTTAVKVYDSDFINTDPDKMKEVLEWIIDKYPADSYGLVFWGHGDGWLVSSDTVKATATASASPAKAPVKRAYGSDNGKNTQAQGYYINVPSLVSVLSGLPKFEYILWDCCNMQCVEDAYEFRHVTKYFIASPAEIPGEGAPYDIVVPDFFNKTDTVGKAIINDYYNYYAKSTVYNTAVTGKGVPLSVVKCSELDSLATITAEKLATFMPTMGRYPLTMSTDSLVYYYKNGVITLMYDMQGFMKKYLSTIDYMEWKTQYDKVVISKMISKSWQTDLSIDFSDFNVTDSNCGGMSMFIPLAAYQGYSGDFQYNELIKKFSWYMVAGWSNYGW